MFLRLTSEYCSLRENFQARDRIHSLSPPNEERAGGEESFSFKIKPLTINPCLVGKASRAGRLDRVADDPRAELAAIEAELTTAEHR